jgi:hypothetical protein
MSAFINSLDFLLAAFRLMSIFYALVSSDESPRRLSQPSALEFNHVDAYVNKSAYFRSARC